MIQSILFFLLGFLTATALALVVSPAIWRRAVLLTRKRMEASVPLTMNEIQADKDRMRAEFAMSTRRLEMNIKSLRDKSSSQIIEINRHQDELKKLSDEREKKNLAVSQLEARSQKLSADLRRAEEMLQRQTTQIADTNKALQQKTIEIGKLGRMYDEAALTSSSRQVELVARETEIDKLSDNIGNMRQLRKDADKRVREAASEVKAAQDELKLERRRSAELDRKVERLLKTVADHEDQLERRKAELADMRRQVTNLPGGTTGGDTAKTIEKLTAEKDQLKDRLITMTRENKKLKGGVANFGRGKTEVGDAERHENAQLREQITDLAAEVVNMTAILEGSASPIRKILADDAKSPARAGSGRVVSLADRVKALQKAAAKK